ncbi:MAG: 5-(carboxyamino)imidazole ribonucleotide mutase [Oligoflexia bacterium]|nr:5-(carboxyamino)imidazole ribonucleotide mutase [Oligoflexia bacterium]
MKKLVGITMGSDSDWPVLKRAAKVLESFGIPYEKRVVSAHRTPKDMAKYGEDAQSRGIQVIIAGAGGAAHLPGMLAAYSILPVIGVPIPTKSLDGLDSLLSIAQMPKGIPVATVAIGNSENAALLALQILSLSNSDLRKKLEKFRKTEAKKSREKNKKI